MAVSSLRMQPRGGVNALVMMNRLLAAALLFGALLAPVLDASAHRTGRPHSHGPSPMSPPPTLPLPPKLLWLDNEVDPSSLDSREKVAAVLDRAQDAGFNVIVPDARNYFGLAYYKSRTVSRAPASGEPDFDFLQTTIGECRARGLKVWAGINLFTDGGKGSFPAIGDAYQNRDWQTVTYDTLVEVRLGDELTTWATRINARGATGTSVLTTSTLAKGWPRRGDGVTTNALVAGITGGRITALFREDDGTSPSAALDGAEFAVVAEAPALAGRFAALTTGTAAAVATSTILLRADEYPHGALLYTNPADPAVRKRNLDVIREILEDYDVDGVILDRARFDNVKTDFSELSRAAFETWTKTPVANWPADICTPANPLTGDPLRPGPRWSEWLLWRAQIIHDFIAESRKIARAHKGKVFADYVGGWYDTYHEVGVNWADAEFDPREIVPHLPAAYQATGYAQMLDCLSTGLYYKRVRASDPGTGPTIENGLALVRKVTLGRVPLAPGVYVPTHTTEEQFEDAIRICIEQGGGVMVFSHSTLTSMNRWDAARRGLEAVPQLLER